MFRIKFRNSLIINFFMILILIKSANPQKFINIKKLSSSDSYFVILDTGLYLYKQNLIDCSLIYQFNNGEYIGSHNNVIVTEIVHKYRAYIFCLVNKFLFIFNERSYQLLNYEINEINIINGNYYNLIPYKVENNIASFIIAFNNDPTNLKFYFYKFKLNESLNRPKEITFNNMNIENQMINCQINSNSTFIICFYYSTNNGKKYLFSSTFLIQNMKLSLEKTSNSTLINGINEINEIKVAKSDNDNFFVCLLSNEDNLICYINNNDLDEFEKINIQNNEDLDKQYKVFYCKEGNDFLLLSNSNTSLTMLHIKENSKVLNKTDTFEPQMDEYSIIYRNQYKIVNYNNFLYRCMDISVLQSNDISEYNQKVKNIIDISHNKNELVTKLNDFLENGINFDYLDINIDLRISKGDTTVELTTTYLQELNRKVNVTTINLGECEDYLKNSYKIPEDCNLYILKLDKQQINKYYPLIEYQVFYPMANEKLQILNLSLCESLGIEISIPIELDEEQIDVYNPKSDYYYDICYKATSDNNTDIPLNDRKDEFTKKNLSLCEDNCEFSSYDNIYKKVKCSCGIKNEISLEHSELPNKNFFNDYLDIKKISNIGIIKCYKIVFQINNIKNNYGTFIIGFVFILYIICTIIFYCKSLKNLIKEIIKIKLAIYQDNKINEIENVSIFKLEKSKSSKSISPYQDFKSNIRGSQKKSSMRFMKKKHNNQFNRNILKRRTRKEKISNILEYTDSELNSLSYLDATKIDKRSFFQYYFSLLKKKQSILFSFYPNKDYNSQIIKSFLFFFFYTSDITVNALFFTDDTMHKIYVDSGSFNLFYQLPLTIYSLIISGIINIIVGYLSLSEDIIISVKKQIKDISKITKKKINTLKMKFCYFFLVIFIFLIIFWLYLSCFCCIYQNTQMHLIKDSLMSLGFSLITPFFISFIPGIFRIPALRNKKRDKPIIYKLSQIIENIF